MSQRLIRRLKALPLPAKGFHLAFLVIIAGALITWSSGQHGKCKIEKDASPCTRFILDNGEEASLPFSVELREAYVEYYPGTASAADYVSILRINRSDEKRVSMNRVLEIQKYRFYQTGIGENYSLLTVNHDPWGIGVTYSGYYLLFISMILYLLWPDTRLRRLISRERALSMTVLICAAAGGCFASPSTTPATIPPTLARHFGEMKVDWDGRVMPIQTMARDFCLKVYGNESYKGLSSEQVLAGWIFYYDYWKNEPFIKIKQPVAELIGAKENYASLTDFYSREGYKLESALSDNISDKNLHEADEKIGYITQVCTGKAIKLVMDKSDEGADVAEVSSGFLTAFNKELSRRQWKNADNLILEVKSQQVPVKVELLYNRLGSPLVPGIIALITALICTGIPALRRIRHISPGAMLCGLTLAWITMVLALRWMIGGHVPLTNGYETMLAMAWLLLITSFIGYATHRDVMGGCGLAAGGLTLLVAYIGRAGATVSMLMPVLASPLLSVHVLLVMAAYALMAMITIISALSLITGNEQYVRLSRVMLYPAVFLMAGGIFIGAIWANQTWGRYWGWDPKETWALITMLVYAVPFHSMSLPCFRRPKIFNTYMMIAFLSVLFTYFGVNYFMTGMHSYA